MTRAMRPNHKKPAPLSPKETSMYKTIVLSLLEGHPELHNHLRLSRKLLSEMERYAEDLKTAHQEFSQTHTRDAAMELAVDEINTRIAQEATRYEK
jgi:hypothetical protein